MKVETMSRESAKLKNPQAWRKWGPYVSDRQWGTVREDYSADGDAWNSVTHDMARSKAYRWGEEGIGGLSDDNQILCWALALWNGQDIILKERLFGLTSTQGNHGEDVKEYYYYLDNTPTHSYQKMLYKYPMAAFPYTQLLEENRRRDRTQPEFELIDTGIFADSRYFDVQIEYAKNAPEDILAQYTIFNRSSADELLHLLPTLWFRNTMDWGNVDQRPVISLVDHNTLKLYSPQLGSYFCYVEGDAQFLFTDNITNNQRLYNSPNEGFYTKDGINDYVVNGYDHAVNADETGTKASAHFKLNVPAHGSITVRMRLSSHALSNPFEGFDVIVAEQKNDADLFYAQKQNINASEDEKQLQRQAWAGMLWTKQYYYYNVYRWLKGDAGQVVPAAGHRKRNADWKHLRAADVISMPDKWEYPWFAAWDLAFHCIVFADIDPEFAKQQLLLLTEDRYMHLNGQLPAYEWDFSDVNPPIHAIATWKVYQTDKRINGVADTVFLQRMLHKLLLNFSWWVNKKDDEGNNIFEGGFLGLDNIGIFDRSKTIPGGGNLEQSDGTSWMAMYALSLTRISVELAVDNPAYEDLGIKFAQHFFMIAGTMANMGNHDGLGLWDEEDSFYYDMLKFPDGSYSRLRYRTIIGLIPLLAVEVIEDTQWNKVSIMNIAMKSFLNVRPDLAALVSNWVDPNGHNKHLLSLLRGHRMKSLFKRMLDENEFLSEYGIRSVSKVYRDQPYEYYLDGVTYSMKYAPAESDIAMFGGNSNWRGPIWMPINYLIIDAMYEFYKYYGDDFKVEYPTHSGVYMTIKEIADSLTRRLKALFLQKPDQSRAFLGDNQQMQTDPFFKGLFLFHEYFNGDTGKGLGANHQTGWTGLIATLETNPKH